MIQTVRLLHSAAGAGRKVEATFGYKYCVAFGYAQCSIVNNLYVVWRLLTTTLRKVFATIFLPIASQHVDLYLLPEKAT